MTTARRALSVEDAYDLLYVAHARSPTLRRVWRHAAGPDYPEAFDHFSFLTLAELERIRQDLRIGTGSILGDLGRGTGGPGLWLARGTGATVALPGLGADVVDDYRPLLATEEFSVVAYEETPGWQERLQAPYAAILSHGAALTLEMGEGALKILLGELSLAVERGLCRRRVLGIAERR